MARKIPLTLIILLFVCNSFCQTATEWQSDLRHLQQTVHSKYNNLFHNISASEWNSAVDKFHQEIPSLNKTEILAGFVKLVAMFHIGHTQIGLFNFHGQDASPLVDRLPLQFYWFNDGIHILRVDKKYEASVGGKVMKIGNMKIEDALNAIRPLVAFENEQGFKSNGLLFLSMPAFLKTQGVITDISQVPITFLKSGKEETINISPSAIGTRFSSTGLETPPGWVVARKSTELPLWQKEPSAFRYMEYLPANKTLYVRHSANIDDGEKTIAAFFSSMSDYINEHDVSKLILDIRMNGGGNNYLNKSIVTSIIESKKINQKGKFFRIIGRRTFSAAQNLVNELEKYTEVIFVGEPTSENVNFYGDTRTETLPNSKLRANLSWLWWQNLDPRDKRKATSPQLAADMSFNDFYSNEDPLLKAIFNYENRSPVVPTVSFLLASGKKDEAYKYAMDFQTNPLYKYAAETLREDLNREGYVQMQQRKLEIANGLFELNMKLFPADPNVYDSYAESLMNMNKNEEAIKYYEMAIAKDKDGVTAENSKRMIERIKQSVK